MTASTTRRFTIPAPSTAEPGASIIRRVLARDCRRCAYCGDAHAPLGVDHIRPKAHFAANAPAALVNAPENLVAACDVCNGSKGPQDLQGFARMLRGRGVPAAIIAGMTRRIRTAARRPLPLPAVP